MKQFYKNLHPAGRLGLWGLPVMVLVVTLLIVELRQPDVPDASGFRDLVSLKDTGNSHKVSLGEPLDNQPQYNDYRSISTITRSRVLQRFSELRALYKQLSLNISIHIVDDDSGLQQTAHQLNEMLAIYNLGTARVKKSEVANLDMPLVLYCAQREVSIAFAFLSAIAPYIHSQATVIETPQLSPGQMQLHLLAKPTFTADGTVVLN